jgi:hypothetical protein
MKYASFLQKKKPNRKIIGVLVAVAIVVTTGLVLKVLADTQSRVDY